MLKYDTLGANLLRSVGGAKPLKLALPGGGANLLKCGAPLKSSRAARYIHQHTNRFYRTHTYSRVQLGPHALFVFMFHTVGAAIAGDPAAGISAFKQIPPAAASFAAV